MFDLNATDGSVRSTEFRSPIPDGDGEGAASVPVHRLDTPAMQDYHRRFLSLYLSELDRQHRNRQERAEDDDFYDSIQWDENDAATLEARGQKPLVYNVISASVDWVCNTEKRTRSDFKVLPRREEGSKPAQRKTSLLKYLSDTNHTPHNRSRAFEDSVISGLGWLEDGISEEGDGEPIYSRYANWREMLHDSRASQFDLSDARYLFRSKWSDLDACVASFPERNALLRLSSEDAERGAGMDNYGDFAMDSAELDTYGISSLTSEDVEGFYRERVRVIEGWLRIPVKTRRMVGGTFDGEIYDPHSRGHVWSFENEMRSRIDEKIVMRMHATLFTPQGLLWFGESPYRHNRYPYTPIWGKRRRRDGMPYGMVRNLKGQQEDINKRASKALYILSTNKVIMDEDALPEDTDLDDFREEVSRPDALIVKRKGSELKLDTDRELSQYQLELMSRSIQMIQQSSGVTDELLGRRTNASSGIAIQRRQDQGSMATAHFFENYRLGCQLQGEKQISLIEQFMGEEKTFRITNERGRPEFITVNDGLPDNDIVRTKADFIISDSDWRASLRQAAVDELIDLISKVGNPQVTLIVLDLLVENMDLQNRDELVKRIRSMTGMKDPDSGDEPTPEEVAQQQAEQEKNALAQRDVLATIVKKEAEGEKLLAEAQAARSRLTNLNVDAQGKALEVAASALALPPAAAHTADMVLQEAGFSPPAQTAAPQPLPQDQQTIPPGLDQAPGLMP